LSVVDLACKSILDGLKVGLESVRGKLHTVGQTLRQVVHEVVSGSGISCANIPTRNQLSIGVHRNPSPNIPPTLRPLLGTDILLLGSNEGPYLVGLNPLASEVAEGAILIARASAAQVAKKFVNRVAGNPGHSADSADAVSFNEGCYYPSPYLNRELIHAVIMRDRSRIVNN